MGQLRSQWTDFHKVWYLSIFRKSVERNSSFLKSNKNNNSAMRACVRAWLAACRRIIVRLRNVSNKICRENKKNTITRSPNNCFPRKSYRLWDSVGKYGTTRQATDGNMTQRMRFACWISMATYTHSKHLILVCLPRQKWLRERAWILRYTYIALLFRRDFILRKCCHGA